jgi:hypothetical protein
MFKLLLLLTVIFYTGCGINLDPNAVDANKYLKAESTPAEVYEKSDKRHFLNPFNFGHTEFGKLILVSIDDHPEIKTVELVVQHDNKGAFVIVYYHNDKADIYTNPHITIDKKYLEPNPDWNIVAEQDFKFTFEDTNNGIDLLLDIMINGDHRIKIKLNARQKDEKRYSFLAAIGAELSDVKRFPFVYLRDAGFVPVEGTEASFEIDGKEMKLTKTPLKVEGRKSYRTPYSFTPLPFFWNEEQEDYLSPEIITGTKSHQKGNAVYSFADNNGHNEIERITYNVKGHSATYRFAPSFPDIGALKTGSEIRGKFCLGVDNIDGIVCGSYSVIKANDEIAIHFLPKKCWQPMPGKDWVSAYRYHAKIKTADTNKYKILSEWTVK